MQLKLSWCTPGISMSCFITEMIEKAFFIPQAAMKTDSSTQLSMVFPTTVWLKAKFCMFLLYSKMHGTGEEANHLDKHYTCTKGEQQSFGNDLPQLILSMFFCNISPVYIWPHSLIQHTNTPALNLFSSLLSRWECLVGGRLWCWWVMPVGAERCCQSDEGSKNLPDSSWPE